MLLSMMKITFLSMLALALYGCGGPSFTTVDLSRADVDSQSEADADVRVEASVDIVDSGSNVDSDAVNSNPDSATLSVEVGADSNDACAPITHNNGLGQTWTDCVPLGTYNESQAMAACAASFGSNCTNQMPAGQCDALGGVAYMGGSITEWVYTTTGGADYAGDVLEFTYGEFVCPNVPGPTAMWN